jgi:hypothetical protein
MKEYTQNIPIGIVQLTKEDLRRLVTMTCAQPQVSPAFTISTRLSDFEISEENLDDFLCHADLPQYLDNLSIQWVDRQSGRSHISHRLYLQLSPAGNNLQVSGYDQTWVLGKCEQLMRFLRGKNIRSFVPGAKTRVLINPPSPFWAKYNKGITLLLALLSLLITVTLGILQLFKK